MQKLVDDVTAFHQACGAPIVTKPKVPSEDRVNLRIELIDEEINRELIPAMREGNLALIADAMIDSIYVIVGAGIEFGIPMEQVWNAVQDANMAKRHPETGMVITRVDGKILKPAGWKPPDVEAIIQNALQLD
jgi:predicted HAD superfamily Cof-like phosphohydrolase